MIGQQAYLKDWKSSVEKETFKNTNSFWNFVENFINYFLLHRRLPTLYGKTAVLPFKYKTWHIAIFLKVKP